MTGALSLDELWDSAPRGEEVLGPGTLSALPESARRYLEHAIARGTRLASAVRLRMHGEIKLRRWLPSEAEQVIHRYRGMIWSAAVRTHGVPIRGSDRLLDGEGSMRWKLLGIIPIVNASGHDITRAAAGRMAAESIWLPSLLCGDDVSWSATDETNVHACFAVQGERADVTFTVDACGRLEAVKVARWGNPENAEFHYADFGGIAEEEGTFDGYTIPTRLRAGWYFGTDRFRSEGEFFRVTIDSATYR